MKSTDERLQTLARAVLNEARSEAEQVLADARAKTEATQQRAQQQADQTRQAILERARQEAAHMRGQCIASAQLRARRLQLERREALLDQVFDAVRQRLNSIQEWSDYPDIAEQLIREAVAHLDADVVHISADPRTETILTDEWLARLSESLHVTLHKGATLERGTGIVALADDGHRQVDNTLEARLHRGQDAYRAPMYHLLLGESL